jgi:hypothetical protein
MRDSIAKENAAQKSVASFDALRRPIIPAGL